ncbi:hypothetical protein TRFO_24485 [Tritrichomonas foetus]|uniref:Uncharacterized protein n=1 Tax=Tritrichomonas foetus TaxID=1144522 RepID=A0A1J4K8W8_9EUKA|nr:hypothetical protein TRFO_24485 [Tritrichomonas foetus]|eukprot:OHT07328.1 hypothetical protein TRFO_24485 [Tritrichomonas foetus]
MTEEVWLDSLKDKDGKEIVGKSAYEIYCENLPEGEKPMTEKEWLENMMGITEENSVSAWQVIQNLINTRWNVADSVLSAKAISEKQIQINATAAFIKSDSLADWSASKGPDFLSQFLDEYQIALDALEGTPYKVKWLENGLDKIEGRSEKLIKILNLDNRTSMKIARI